MNDARSKKGEHRDLHRHIYALDVLNSRFNLLVHNCPISLSERD